MLRELLGGKPRSIEERATAPKTDTDWRGWWRTGGGAFGLGSTAGPEVTDRSAMSLASVYACVRVVSEAVAQLPLVLYRRLERGRERAEDHPLYPILHDLPNPELTSFELREFMAASLLLRGNAVAWVDRGTRGEVREVWPLRWDWIDVKRAPSGELLFTWEPPNGRPQTFEASELWRVRGLGFDGVQGVSPIQWQAETIGLGLAVNEFGSRFFANGAVVSGALEHPQKLSPEAHERLKVSMAEFRGLSQSHKAMILEEGMKWNKISIPPEEAQFLETRKYSRSEIAGLFGVPPHMIGDLEHATFSNIEHQAIAFVVHCLGPWLERFEQSISRDLLLEDERKTLYAEHVVAGLLRGDAKTRAEFYNLGVNGGWLVRNEVRELENLNPIPGLDKPLTPLNMVVGQPVALSELDEDGEPVKPEPEPEPDPEPDPEPRGGRRRETRAKSTRRRLADGFAPTFEEAAARAFRAEQREVTKLAEANLRALDTFGEKLRELYADGGELRRVIERSFATPFRALALAAWEDGADEIDAPFDRAAAEAWASSITVAYVSRHAATSESAILERAGRGGEALAEVAALFAGWLAEGGRGAAIAKRESTFTSRGGARKAWASAGRGAKWVTSDPCEICAPFDGRSVSADGDFARAGDELNAGAGKARLPVAHTIKNPPMHDGCECEISPA